MEKELIDQFIRRVAYGMEIKKIDSAGVHGGSPFYFYCNHCGVPIEVFPEKPLLPPAHSCTQCNYMLEKNILDEAKKILKDFFCLNSHGV